MLGTVLLSLLADLEIIYVLKVEVAFLICNVVASFAQNHLLAAGQNWLMPSKPPRSSFSMCVYVRSRISAVKTSDICRNFADMCEECIFNIFKRVFVWSNMNVSARFFFFRSQYFCVNFFFSKQILFLQTNATAKEIYLISIQYSGCVFFATGKKIICQTI